MYLNINTDYGYKVLQQATLFQSRAGPKPDRLTSIVTTSQLSLVLV